MYVQKVKAKENKSRAITNSVAQMKDNRNRSFGLVDNRPETIIRHNQRPVICQNGVEGEAAHLRTAHISPSHRKNFPLQLVLKDALNWQLEQDRIQQYHDLETQGNQRAVNTVASNLQAINDYQQARALRVQVMAMHIPGTDPGAHQGAVNLLDQRIEQRHAIIRGLRSKEQSKQDKKNNKKPPGPGKGGGGGSSFGTGSQASWLPGNQSAWIK